MGQLVAGTANPAGSFERLEALYATVLDHRRRWLESVVKLVGGVEENRALTGTGEVPYVRVDRARAKAAAQFVLEHLRTPKAFLAPDILGRIKPVGVVGPVAKQQLGLLDQLLDPLRYGLLDEQAVVDPANAYALLDYLGDVQDGVFEELRGASVQVDAIRRQLQRHYLARLFAQVRADDLETDLAGAARASLVRLDAALAAALPKAADATVAAHLTALRFSIDGLLRPAATPAPRPRPWLRSSRNLPMRACRPAPGAARSW